MLLLNVLTLSSFTSREIEVGIINDNTSIENDLVSLGLTPSDYINLYEEYFNSQNDGSYKELLENYNETYLIAVGENRLDDESTDVYLYLYNPIFHMFSFKAYYINLKINNIAIKLAYYSEYTEYDYESSDEKLQFCNVTDDYTIYKFKFSYINHVNERKYELDSIKMYYDWAVDFDRYLLNKEYKNPFTATFKEREEDGKLVTNYEYNSFIYITEDEIVQLHFDDLTVFKESSIILDFLVGIFGSSGMGNAIYFYNFSSSKNIDQILEADVNYILHTHQGYYSKPLFGNIKFDGVDDYKTISTTIYATDESEIMVYDQLEKFKAFKTPSNDRLNEFTDKMNITDEFKSKFINYQHSICFLVATNNDSRNSSGEGFVNLSYVENFKISRLKFETNGKIYNSYVADDPDDGGTDFDDVESIKDWFDEMIDWIKENPLYAVLILLAVIVGLPLIISFLPMILKGLIELIIGIIKLFFWIIFAPFRFIKNKINEAKEKKKIKQREAIK